MLSTVQGPLMKASPIFWLMLLAIAAIAGLAYVDEEREGAAALADFAQEQTTLAQSLAGALSAHVFADHRDVPAGARDRTTEQPLVPSVIERYLSLAFPPSGSTDQPHRLMVLFQPPGTAEFHSTDGRSVVAPEILAALEQGRTYLRLAPAEAGHLGLPLRTALAGLARVDAGSATLFSRPNQVVKEQVSA
jgi:hypothetical protein